MPENSLRLVTAKESLHRSECGSGCGSVCEAWGRGKRAVCAGVQRREAERGSRENCRSARAVRTARGVCLDDSVRMGLAGLAGKTVGRAIDRTVWKKTGMSAGLERGLGRTVCGLRGLPERTERGAV